MHKEEERLDANDTKKAQLNVEVMRTLFCAVSKKKFEKSKNDPNRCCLDDFRFTS